MDTATFRFYADLNYFLPAHKKQRSFPYPVYDGNQSVNHLIEAQGIPHTEVELILVNGSAVDFNHLVKPGEFISIYPAFSSIRLEQNINTFIMPLNAEWCPVANVVAIKSGGLKS